MREPTKAELVAALRDRVILRTERGNKLVGHVCDICKQRWWSGKPEKHRASCVLAPYVRSERVRPPFDQSTSQNTPGFVETFRVMPGCRR